jgi:hypothetical protein
MPTATPETRDFEPYELSVADGRRTLVALPGRHPALVDPATIVAVRVEHTPDGSGVVIISTTEGFGFAVLPDDGQPIAALFDAIETAIADPA